MKSIIISAIIILSLTTILPNIFADEITLTTLAPSTWRESEETGHDNDIYASNSISPTNGNVGIGVEGPEAKLDVRDNGGWSLSPYPGRTGIIASSGSSDDTEDKYAVAGYAMGQGDAYGIFGLVTATGGTNRGVFGAAINGDTNWAGYFAGDVYMTRVGIGDLEPDGYLEVNPDSIEDNGDEVVVDENGYVGIGTTDPQSKLEIRASSDSRVKINDPDARGSAYLDLDRGSDGRDRAMVSFGEDGTPVWYAGLPYQNGTTNDDFIIAKANYVRDGSGWRSPEFTVINNGNVGIGTVSPETKLRIRSSDSGSSYPTATTRGDVDLWVTRSNQGIEFGTAGATNARRSWILARHYSTSTYGDYLSTLHLQPSVGVDSRYRGVAIGYDASVTIPTDRARLAVNGAVGIGTMNPRAELDIRGVNPGIELRGPIQPHIDFTNTAGGGDYDMRIILIDDDTLAVVGGRLVHNDIAEIIPASGDLEGGDVVVIDSERIGVKKSTKPYDPLVAGIISKNPTFLIGDITQGLPLALAGRVKTKVTKENGAIEAGDLLTTSTIPGYAMKAAEPKIGTILGKALEPLTDEEGEIMVLVTLQ